MHTISVNACSIKYPTTKFIYPIFRYGLCHAYFIKYTLRRFIVPYSRKCVSYAKLMWPLMASKNRVDSGETGKALLSGRLQSIMLPIPLSGRWNLCRSMHCRRCIQFGGGERCYAALAMNETEWKETQIDKPPTRRIKSKSLQPKKNPEISHTVAAACSHSADE